MKARHSGALALVLFLSILFGGKIGYAKFYGGFSAYR